MNDLKQKTISGLLYKFLERGFAKGIGFVVSVILARMLCPEDYGLIALVMVVIAFCDVFVTSGFSSALVVDKDADTVDFSTCFHFNVLISLALYAVVFFSAPFLATFFGSEMLVSVIRVLGIRIPLAAINSIEQAWIQKEMKFKFFFWATLVGTVVSGVIAIIMAFNGFGVWALVEQTLGNMLIDTAILWVAIKWKPSLVFDTNKFKKQFKFGWKVLVTGLIDTTYSEMRSLAIGKVYSSDALAYYNRGTQFSELGMTIVEPTISGVLFPALSKCNDDKELMKKATRRSLKLSSFIIFPCMVGIAACGESLINVLLTEKWMPCLIFLEIGCLAYLFRPMQVINNSLIKASGRSSLLLVLDVIKKSLGVLLVVVTINISVVAVAWSFAITNFLSVVINVFAVRKIIDYGFFEQFKDIAIYALLSLVMGLVVYLLSLIGLPSFVALFLQICCGVALYFGICWIIKEESFEYCLSMLRSIFHMKG